MKAPDSAIRLVVNADGFAGDATITRGTLRAHREGIVTSTSVIGNCTDPSGVRAELATVPDLGIGVHLTLTGGAPIARSSPHRCVRVCRCLPHPLRSLAGDCRRAWSRSVDSRAS